MIICNTESKLANASLVVCDFMLLDHCGYTLHALLTLIKSAVSLRRESMSLSCNSLRHRSYCSMLYSVIWDHGCDLTRTVNDSVRLIITVVAYDLTHVSCAMLVRLRLSVLRRKKMSPTFLLDLGRQGALKTPYDWLEVARERVRCNCTGLA